MKLLQVFQASHACLLCLLHLQLAMVVSESKSEFKASDGCYSPTGIDTDGGISLSHVMNLLDGTTLGEPLPFLFLPMAEPLIDVLQSSFETPIQFRQALYHGNTCYNAAAMFHPTALDIFGQDDHRICLEDFPSEDVEKAHEQVTLAYTFALSGIEIAPGSAAVITSIMDNVLNLPMSLVPEQNADPGTPWGLAKISVEQMSEYAKSDGWNNDGSLRTTDNKMPFSDFEYEKYSPYKVSTTPLKGNMCEKEWSWEPLLETNYRGYFTKQEFVTPFAGFTGRLYGMTSSEYAKFSIPEPDYDYCEEADFVLSETNEMAVDDLKKAEIEFFDSKFTSLLPMQIDWSIKNQFSSFEFWYYDMILVTAMYDATLLAWREKVFYNAVRPTTVVYALKGEEKVETFAGPFAGSALINANEWQPYIRTMPHAEYPSGSSCICTAYVESLQMLTGTDETGDFAVGVEMPAGSSKIEPGMTPAEPISMFYTKWSEVQHSCGQSRLYAGMHFSTAVPAGEELCSGVASLIVERANLLKDGDASGAFADLNDTSIEVKVRKKGSNKSSKSKSKKKKKNEKKKRKNNDGSSLRSKIKKKKEKLSNEPIF